MHIHTLEQWRHSHDFHIDSSHGERRTLYVVLLTACMMVVEIAAGYLYGSMALLADGWHMGTHVAALGISLIMILVFGGSRFETILSFVFLSMPVFLAITIGIAILRYRLFDIDLIIRRTLQYALLTAILALVYLGGVVLLQAAVGGLTGQADSPFIVVLTTLGIAALFNPLRVRIQDWIDRRFIRRFELG